MWGSIGLGGWDPLLKRLHVVGWVPFGVYEVGIRWLVRENILSSSYIDECPLVRSRSWAYRF